MTHLDTRIGLVACIAAVSVALSGCYGQPTREALAAASRRDLTTAEKVSLTRSMSQTLKDPDSAHFKWMPVVLIRRTDGATNYCGLLNSKNSYAGYVGFQPFYAQLTSDAKGQFATGIIRIIEEPNNPNLPADNVRGLCRGFGYEVSQAN